MHRSSLLLADHAGVPLHQILPRLPMRGKQAGVAQSGQQFLEGRPWCCRGAGDGIQLFERFDKERACAECRLTPVAGTIPSAIGAVQ